MASRARVLTTKEIFRGKIVRLKLDRVVEPGGVTVNREVVCHGGSVVVLPILPDGRVLLVRQFRYPARQSLWELVAGGIERGESLRAAARRELLEEAGYQARTIKPLLDFYSSPGFLTERMHLVEARGLRLAKARPEANERIQSEQFTVRQIRALLRAGKIRDGKTLVGLLWLFFKQTAKG